VLLVVIGLGLRLQGYTEAPKPADNVDDLAWAWAGISLWEEHVPTAWSYQPAYRSHFTLVAPGTGRVLPGVRPWFDHPPGFALLIGGFSMLAGEREFSQVTAGVVRLPVIGLSLLTLVLAYLLGRRLLGRWPALTGAALFALAPGAILGSRQVESEALLAPMLLLVLLLAHRIVEDEAGRLDPALLLATCALAPLVKVPGAALGAIAAVILAVCGRRRLAGVALAMSALGLLGFAAYGFLIDWGQFLAATQAQAARHSGLLSGYTFITAPAGFADVEPLRDGWWLLGWLSLGLLFRDRDRPRRDLFLAFPIVAYAVVIMLIAADPAVAAYGWYRFAVYPLVYLAAGDLLVATIRRPTLVRLAVLLVVPGATATLGLGPSGSPWEPPLLLELAAAVVLVGAAVAAGLRGQQWRTRMLQLTAGGLVAVVLVLNVAQSLRLAEIYRSL
jgi:4-amino-4-deoxy-L-arabinose transferase-like glycosyltransferase